MRIGQAISVSIAVAVTAYFVAAFFNHPPAQSQDWAAWVQAIGSIGAILVAVFVTNWQIITQATSEERRRMADELIRFEAVKAVLSMIHVICVKVRDEARAGNLALGGPGTGNYLLDAKAALQALPLFQLPDARLIVFATTISRSVEQLREQLARNRGLGREWWNEVISHANEVLRLTEEAGALCETEILKRRK